MKRTILILILLSLVLALYGCGTDAPETRVQVSLMEIEGCTVENNGLWILPGEDAVFRLTLDRGCTLASTDYPGGYSTELKDGKLELTLEDITYPVRVNMTLTKQFCTVTYEPNGGKGEALVRTYDRTNHLRPNTALGTDLFSRSGHTLTGWNTEPDGSGTRVGLGSRVTVDEALTLYAQWIPWSPASDFTYTLTQFGSITINSYEGTDETVVIPAYIDGYPVTTVATRAFRGSSLRELVLPITMDRVAPGAFQSSAVETVTMFDNIQVISDDAFQDCAALRTLYINAAEAPWGYAYRKESGYADKVDLMIQAQGQKKLVLYSGCSGWYNLDGKMADEAFGGAYTVINMGLNGTVTSSVQMQILGHYLEDGDVLFHTLELTSQYQLLDLVDMGAQDDNLWCGLEYNYDLFSLVDLRTVKGAFDSLTGYLDKKKSETDYQDYYTDSKGNRYLDAYGCIPFDRSATKEALLDRVELNPDYITDDAMARLESYYDGYQTLGVTVYVSYACVNMDQVPEEQRGNVELMDTLVKQAIGEMQDVAVVSDLKDFIFEQYDFYDTNYHLRSRQAKENTEIWLRDLQAQMVLDGLWEEGA